MHITKSRPILASSRASTSYVLNMAVTAGDCTPSRGMSSRACTRLASLLLIWYANIELARSEQSRLQCLPVWPRHSLKLCQPYISWASACCCWRVNGLSKDRAGLLGHRYPQHKGAFFSINEKKRWVKLFCNICFTIIPYFYAAQDCVLSGRLTGRDDSHKASQHLVALRKIEETVTA